MKYKVGDKVRIKSREWYDKNKGDDGDVDVPCGFTKEMSDLCGKDAVITLVYKRFYVINIDNGEFRWSDEMFEDSELDNHENQ